MQIIVETQEGVTFKWFKDLVELEGETGPTLSYENASYRLNGTYRVEVIGPEGKSYSKDAFFFVRATPYQRYLEDTYEEPFSSDLSNTEDLDGDGFQNHIEFVLGSDLADPQSKPLIYFEVVEENGQTTAMLIHSVAPNKGNSQIQIEVSEDLSAASWIALNVVPDESDNERTYSWILTGRQFIRIRIIN
jgi:hypothetical protein